MENILKRLSLLAFIGILLVSCSDKEASDDAKSKTVLKCGVASYSADDAQFAIDGFNQNSDQYHIETVMFDDITTPNVALNDGDIDMNFFQHISYLENYNEEYDTNLVPVKGKGVYKIQNGLYANEYDSIDDFKEGDTIVISSDIINRSLCLKMLEDAGLIKLNDAENPGLPDIIENPLNLNIAEVDTPVVHMDSDNVDAAIVKGEQMVRDGRDPSKALMYASPDLLENFQQCLVVREEDQNAEWAVALFDEFTSERMEEYYIETYGEGVMLVE